MAATSRPPSRRSTSKDRRDVAVQRDGAAHRVSLAFEALVIDAGSAPDPILGRAAVKRVIDGRRDGGVADAHFAERQHVGAARYRLHAIRDGRGAFARLHGRGLGDVAGRQVEGGFEHLQPGAVDGADLVDGGAARGKIFQHLRGDARRIGRHALRDDAMIGGEHHHGRAVDGRLGAVLPSREPFDDFLEPAERARRLGQLGVARAHGGDGVRDALGICASKARKASKGCSELLIFMSNSSRLWRSAARRGAAPVVAIFSAVDVWRSRPVR